MQLPKQRDNDFIDYCTFMAMEMEEPRWLIEGIWTASSHGLIGGEPKTNKSVLSLAAALSVGSGKPFLMDDRYPVHTTGPVLIIQEENAPWVMRDRTLKMASFYGLLGTGLEIEETDEGALGDQHVNINFPPDLPIYFLNNYGFDLSAEADQHFLLAKVQEVKPVLLILDPLYLIIGGADTDRSSAVVPFLKWLLWLRFEYNCAIMLVHHQGKKGEILRRAGQRMLGSTTFHGWVESAIYTEKPTEDEEMALSQRSGSLRDANVFVKVEREFRNVQPHKPLEVQMKVGSPGSLEFEAKVMRYNEMLFVQDLINQEPGITLAQLAKQTGLDITVLQQRLESGGYLLKAEKKGRGMSHRVYPNGSHSSDSKEGVVA